MFKEQNPWPDLYKVVIKTRSNNTYEYIVNTWLSEEKAIAIAVLENERRHGENIENALYNVAVEKIGPAPKVDDVAHVSKGDLTDRWEF